ncbi:hypothetical protein P3T42_005644 [Paraburkholderia sp. GAS38]|uniref:DUF4148 domain-containing protein n=1 Tax=Paraburkholderia sp. GAS38 TaxID=3035133 RepID=UPI003D21B21D
MNLLSKTAVVTLFALGSASAFAAKGLTPQQCNDYPFTPLKAEVTHAQLMQELAELEAVGYDPSENDEDYPSDLELAEKKLQAEYHADCVPAGAQNSLGAGADTTQGTPAS